MFEPKVLQEKLESEKIQLTANLKTCLNLGMNLLKSEQSISEFEESWFEEFSKTILDIWLPNPNDKEKKKKTEVQKFLPKTFSVLKKNSDSIFTSGTSKKPKPTYENSKLLFDEWRKSVEKTRSVFEKDAISFANPYLTISVEDNLEKGTDFQKHAKIGSSLETKWGNWGEKALELFNENLIPVHSGRIDFRLGKILYDVKSGPNVLNIRDVDGAKLKQAKIIELSTKKSFKNLIGVNNFSVGIVYGREELASTWMKDSNGLIIFGVDTWKTLTGDEWNAYKFFVWNLRYNVQELKQTWSEEDLTNAVKMFINSFYGEDEKSLEKALSHTEFKKIK